MFELFSFNATLNYKFLIHIVYSELFRFRYSCFDCDRVF